METMKYSELSNELLCTPETNKNKKLKRNKLFTESLEWDRYSLRPHTWMVSMSEGKQCSLLVSSVNTPYLISSGKHSA